MHRECRAKFSNCMRPDVDAPWIAQASSPQVSGASELAIQFSALHDVVKAPDGQRIKGIQGFVRIRAPMYSIQIPHSTNESKCSFIADIDI